MTRESSIDKH